MLTNMILAVTTLSAELQRRDASPYMLTLLGDPGTGKTRLATALHAWAVRNLRGHAGWEAVWQDGVEHQVPQYRDVWWIQSNRMLKRIREGDSGYIDDAAGRYFVLIDDLGSEYQTPFATSVYDELIDRRVGKWTLITSNLTLEQMRAELGARIPSRLLRQGGQVLQTHGTIADYSTR